MSQPIASKNLYDLLGNDPELDPDRAPDPPAKGIDKPAPRAGKRNAGAEAPVAGGAGRPAAGARGGRSEGVNRDTAGAGNNRAEGRDGQDRGANRNRDERRGGAERGRGRGAGRGYKGRFPQSGRDDRGNHNNVSEHPKQAAHGWGEEGGNAEWNDEKAGADMAKAEAKNESGWAPDTTGGDPAFANGPDGATAAEDAAPAEPEEKTKSYEEYQAELAEKRAALNAPPPPARKANEGSKQKLPEGSAISRENEEDFFVGGGGKAKRDKTSGREKNNFALDTSYYAAPEQDRPRGGREGGGRGGGRGGRGRGEGRGDRGGRGGRGDFRGGAPRGGPRGGSSAGAFNANDSQAFPALGK